MKTHYEIMGIPASATIKEIKKAYVVLARKYHPDKVVEATPEDQNLWHRISNAYKELTDTASRKKYDTSIGIVSSVVLSDEDIENDRQQALNQIELLKGDALLAIHHQANKKGGGLVITQATYMTCGSFGPKSKQNEEQDVTLSLQSLVDDRTSVLILPEGKSKSTLNGFYDPAPNKEKILEVRYLFKNQPHKARVLDWESLVIPNKSHLTSIAERPRTGFADRHYRRKTIVRFVGIALAVGTGIAMYWWQRRR
eukprot:TRINITY_DN774217_c0_g1_i1.p1 TRINITY_DN774217_c0_g1~~TRINITY_DN774217_c0_g1_i1.p1  ORF type:complete len:254 (-),score=60.26 TRINITY_DN774217_c0_g1_i1:217-978(-)